MNYAGFKGLVSRVIDHKLLIGEVNKYAQRLTSTVTPRSLRIRKRQVYEAHFQTWGDATDVSHDERWQVFNVLTSAKVWHIS